MKHIKRLIILIMMVMVLLVGKTTIVGYINYYKVVHEIGLENTIENIQTSDQFVQLEDLPDNFLNATVSVEDKRFYTHNGIDYISIGRAMLTNIQERSFVSGGSTITQQLSKNLFLTFDKTFERKATEYFLAKKIESLYSKNEILEIYVNVINYGDNCIGINAASQHYYNIAPNKLSFTQSILLAGLPQSPQNYNLTSNYDKAVIRSERVIYAMVSNNIIEKETGLEILALIKREKPWNQY